MYGHACLRFPKSFDLEASTGIHMAFRGRMSTTTRKILWRQKAQRPLQMLFDILQQSKGLESAVLTILQSRVNAGRWKSQWRRAVSAALSLFGAA